MNNITKVGLGIVVFGGLWLLTRKETAAAGTITIPVDPLTGQSPDGTQIVPIDSATGLPHTNSDGTPITSVTISTPFPSPAPGTTYTLGIVISPTGGGSVTASPSQATYTPGQIIKLTATPSTGYSFAGWSGINLASQDQMNRAISYNVQGNAVVSALFVPTPTTVATSEQLAAWKAAGATMQATQAALNAFEYQWFIEHGNSPVMPSGIPSGITMSDAKEVFLVLSMGRPYNPVYTGGIDLASTGQVNELASIGEARVNWESRYANAEFWGTTQYALVQQKDQLKTARDIARANYSAALAVLPSGSVSESQQQFFNNQPLDPYGVDNFEQWDY